VTADRQAALEKLGDLFLEFAGTPEGSRFFEAQHSETIAPRNDPAYIEALLAKEQDRQLAANEVTLVTHFVEYSRNRIALTLRNDRDHSKAREVAASIAKLLEAQQRYVPDPHDKMLTPDISHKQPPKHAFGREKRSLGNSDARPSVRQGRAGKRRASN
jgi:hypothetical protein